MPYVGGLEGYGKVIAVGSDKNKELMGKTGNMFFKGSYGGYSTHSVAEASMFIPYEKNEELLGANPFAVNPLTSSALHKLAMTSKTGSFI